MRRGARLLEVRRIEKAWSFREPGQAPAEAGTVAEPYLPLSSCGLDRDPTRIGAKLLYALAAKATWAELNAEFLGSHAHITLNSSIYEYAS
jgi:hypothetical protein